MDLTKNTEYTLTDADHRGEFEGIEKLLGAFLFGKVALDLARGLLQGLPLRVDGQQQAYFRADSKFPAVVHMLRVRRKP